MVHFETTDDESVDYKRIMDKKPENSAELIAADL